MFKNKKLHKSRAFIFPQVLKNPSRPHETYTAALKTMRYDEFRDVCSGLVLCYNADMKRSFYVATRDINEAKIIYSERASVTSPSYIIAGIDGKENINISICARSGCCEYVDTKTGKTCSVCAMIYCKDECKEKDALLHSKECGRLCSGDFLIINRCISYGILKPMIINPKSELVIHKRGIMLYFSLYLCEKKKHKMKSKGKRSGNSWTTFPLYGR